MTKQPPIYLPDHLTESEIDAVHVHIDRMIEMHPENENDYVLVDTIKGGVNVKFFKSEMIETMAKMGGVKPRDVIRDLMRMQNEGNDVASGQLRF